MPFWKIRTWISQKASKIADALLRTQPNIKTVLKPLTPVIGEFRVREFEVVAGEPRTETIHREYGCRYKVDLARAYFTPRLSTERSRILSWIKEGDTVVDMFAGVGPYSILLAKSKKPSKVIAIDKNPDAVHYLKENITLNSAKNIEAIEGDAREEAKKFAGTADHVIMNLPHNAHEFLDSAVLLTKPWRNYSLLRNNPGRRPFRKLDQTDKGSCGKSRKESRGSGEKNSPFLCSSPV